MLLTTDNEMNPNTKVSAELSTKPIAAHQSDISTISARDSITITSLTSSANSCASSTDSGVIITDNKRTCRSDSNSNNYKNMIQGDINTNNSVNCTNANIAQDNSTNLGNDSDDKRRRSEETSKSNRNITINSNVDNNSINIENLINVRRQRHCSSGSGSRKSSKNGSPAVSIRSNTISIISIDENAIDSSVVDSDSDFEGQHSSYVVKRLGQQRAYEPNHPNMPNINKGMRVLSQTISPGAIPSTAGPLSETILNGGTLSPPVLGTAMAPNTAQIGSIALSNSTDVTFGDKHFYEGPVTIQQFLIDSRDKRKSGEENPAFSGEDKEFDPENPTKSNDSVTQHVGPYKFIFNRRAVLITGSVVLLTILVGIIIVAVMTLTKQTIRKSKLIGDGDDSRKHIPINSTIETPDEYIFNGTLLMISKDEWFAEPAKDDIEILKLPVPRVIIAHTASTTCEDKLQCDERVKSVQAFHMHSNRWSDIGYNFLVGGNGLVYEGRGWYEMGAHTKGYNIDSIGIAFIGTFNEEVPTDNDLLAAKLLIEEGVKLGVIAQDYRLYGARQMGGTESPGKALYNIITKWPHWSRKI